MDIIIFEDNEIDILIECINSMQMIFHPTYAPCGKFEIDDIIKFNSKDIIVIVDSNIISPICDIVKKGCLENKLQQVKIAMFVAWLKFIGARVTCGLGLIESDTANLSSISGEEKRKQFLYAIDNIPAQLWKALAFEEIEKIPEDFLINQRDMDVNKGVYCYKNELHYLMNEAAIIKIVQLLHNSKISSYDKFIDFMEWYCDNLIIADSIVIYAAMIFGDVPNIAKPKYSMNKQFEKIVSGIKNQVWDMTYITHWSTIYYCEEENRCTMFATDDKTLKFIISNVIPSGTCCDNVNAIFESKSQQKRFNELCQKNLVKIEFRRLKVLVKK